MVRSPADLYALTLPQLVAARAHGEKSGREPAGAIEKSKNTTLPRLLYGSASAKWARQPRSRWAALRHARRG